MTTLSIVLLAITLILWGIEHFVSSRALTIATGVFAVLAGLVIIVTHASLS